MGAVCCGDTCSALEIWGIVAFFIAVLILLCISIRMIQGVYRMWIGPALGRNIDVLKMGKWAVVTGCTDGIGKAIAYEIAKRKVNIVLISRSESKLRDVAAEIENLYKVETKIITADFTKGYGIYENIKQQLKGLEIGTLVNNVGTMPFPNSYIHKQPDLDSMILNTIHCNVFSVQFMTHIVLPQMVARRRGLIVNVSSGLSVMPCPFAGVYGATKAYVTKYTQDLSLEYAKSGVHIQATLTGTVSTNLNPEKTSFRAPAPDVYAKAFMRSLGMSNESTVYFPHTAMIGISNMMSFLMPQTINTIMRSTMMKRTGIKDKELD